MRKPWREVTEEEIRRVTLRKCAKCRYHGGHATTTGTSNVTCDYILLTGHRRGVRPEDCQYYKHKTGGRERKGDSKRIPDASETG